jgi:hypothetical protein
MLDEPELPENIKNQFITIKRLRDAALILFDKFVEHQNELSSPVISKVLFQSLVSPEEKHQFLSLEETERIVREHSFISPGVYAIGGDTSEKAVKQVKNVMAALMQRIMSNLLRMGADLGLLDVMFDGETNDFRFDVSNKGQKLYERIKTQLENGEDVELDFSEDEKD